MSFHKELNHRSHENPGPETSSEHGREAGSSLMNPHCPTTISPGVIRHTSGEGDWSEHGREAGSSLMNPHCPTYRFCYPLPHSPEQSLPKCPVPTHPDYMQPQSSPWTDGGTASAHRGMMPGEIYDAVASICPDDMHGHTQGFPRTQFQQDTIAEADGPLTVYRQPCLDQLGENNTALCNMNGRGQVVVVNPGHRASCSPETHYFTSSSSKDVGVLVSSSQMGAMVSTSVFGPGGDTSSSQPYLPSLSQGLPPGIRIGGSSWDNKSKKPCNCTKSQCLKLYCDCFAKGDLCSNCNCINCFNTTEHEMERNKAVKICLDRNPEAFRPKIGNGKSGEVKGRNNKGCNCKRSGCLKNYCECFEAHIKCSSTCKCVDCKNYEDSPKRKTAQEDSPDTVCDSPDTTFYKKAKCQKNKCPLAGITLDVVEATCGCMLAQAEEAEKEGSTSVQAERMILEEFGQCLSHIVGSIFKSTDTSL